MQSLIVHLRVHLGLALAEHTRPPLTSLDLGRNEAKTKKHQGKPKKLINPKGHCPNHQKPSVNTKKTQKPKETTTVGIGFNVAADLICFLIVLVFADGFW